MRPNVAIGANFLAEKHSGLSCLVTSILVVAAADVRAQSDFQEEVTVQAPRREMPLQNVPIAVTAVSGESLTNRFAQDLRDLTNAAPNVQLEPVGIFQNSASFYIRGLGTSDIESTVDGKVGVYIDGVAQARTSTALGDMVDVRAVEILRGPQGTLFGRNTIGGAVLVMHNEPVIGERSGRVSLRAGDFGRFDVSGVANLSFDDDSLAGRIAVKKAGHDGYWFNRAVGSDRGATDRVTVFPSLKWAPSDSLALTVRGEFNRTRDDTNLAQSHHFCRDDPFNLFTAGPLDNHSVISSQTLYNVAVLQQDPVTAAAGAASLCAQPLEGSSSDREYATINTEDRGQHYDTDVHGLTLELDYSLEGKGDFTYIGNHRDTDEDIVFSNDIANHDLFAGRRIQDHYQTSHEFRFASDVSGSFDFVAGAYFFEQEYAMKWSSWGMLFAPNVVLTEPDPTAITFTHPSTYGQAQFSTQLNRSWALFSQANFHLGGRLTLSFGGRYTSETKRFRHCALGAGDDSRSPASADGALGCNGVPAHVIDLTQPPVFDPPDTTGAAIPTPLWALTPAVGFDASGGAEGGCRPVLDPGGSPITCNNRLAPPEAKWTEFTPTAGASYEFDENLFGYVSWTEGFSSGGWNGRGTTATSIGPFEPEVARNLEIGLKSVILDGRLRINAAVFDSRVKNYQTGVIRAAPGGGGQETIQSNLGKLHNSGIEVETTWVPRTDLTIWGNASFMHNERSGFCTDPDGFEPSLTPDVSPTMGGPYSQNAPVCGQAQSVSDAIGNFLGWLVPVDVSDILQNGRSPEWTATAGASYRRNLNFGSLTFSGDWQWFDEQLIASSRINEPDGVLQYNGDFISNRRKATSIVNLSVAWSDPEERYRVAAFVKNAGDELYNQLTVIVGDLFGYRVPNLRRHWGVEFGAQFGDSR